MTSKAVHHRSYSSRWVQPYGVLAVSIASGLVSYRISLHAWCCICYAFRISSSTSNKLSRNYIAATVVTPMAVVSSAIISSHISIQCYKHYINPHVSTFSYPRLLCLNYEAMSMYDWNSEFHQFVAICSVATFAILRGIQLRRSNIGSGVLDVFRVIAPSDLWCVGSFGRYCITRNVKRGQYATEAQKMKIETYGRKYGCHHCGRIQFVSSKFKSITKPLRKRLNRMNYLRMPLSLTEYIADHIPPSKVRKLSRQKQVFLPQCQSCSNKQAHSVSSQKKTLMIHNLTRNIRLIHLWIPFPWIFNYFMSDYY
eukprot:65963_1